MLAIFPGTLAGSAAVSVEAYVVASNNRIEELNATN